MKKYTDIFTTGEAARICKCSLATIIRDFDEGILKGFKIRTLRRIPLKNLLEYMNEIGMPKDWQEPLLEKKKKNGKLK